MPDKPPLFEANGCLRKASNRLKDARALLSSSEGTNEGCCFFSHQTGEMSFKGLIWHYTAAEPTWDHDLRRLLQRLLDTDFGNHPKYNSIRLLVPALEKYYIASRYIYEDDLGNIRLDYTRREAEDSVAAAEQIYRIARSVVPVWDPGRV